MSGTFNIPRDLWDDTAFKDAVMSPREAFIWLMAQASWKARVRRIGTCEIELKRGQLVASTRFLAKAWIWSEARVRRFLNMLEDRRMIDRVTDAGVNVITICKYDVYQNSPRVDDAPSEQEPTHQRRTSDAKENTREIREYIPDAKASGRDASIAPSEEDADEDFAKQVFDRGVAYLGRHGVKDREARSLIGKWRKTIHDRDIFDAFAACSRAGVVDPVPWLMARLRPPDNPSANIDAIWDRIEGKAQ